MPTVLRPSAPSRARRPAVPDRAAARAGRAASYLLVVLTAGAYLPSPLYPGYQQAFGIGDLGMTLVYATFAVVSAPVLLLFGTLSDAVGHRSLLRAGIVIAALGSLCFAAAQGPGWLLAGRAAQGLALGAVTGAASALIVRRAPGGDRARASLRASTAFVTGAAAGPIGAGLLAQYAPEPLVLPYLVHLVLLAIAWQRVAVLGRPQGARRGPARAHVPRGMRMLFATAGAAGFLAWAAAGLFLAVMGAVLDRAAGSADLALSGGVIGAVLVCSGLAQPLVAWCGPRAAQAAGLGAVLAGLVTLASTGGTSVPFTVAAAVLTGTGLGLAYGGATAAVSAQAPPDAQGAIASLLYLVFYLGAGLPAVAVGALSLWHPLPAAVFWMSCALAACVPPTVAAVLCTRPRRRGPAPGRAGEAPRGSGR
ncbi:putative MFS family arabinose efflux permease [Murinocardiopsis flavida]|uniref:Putative MFS family arabinose efflux permease n=1 Tax=Murinocardiopsis flavida TaxID=645275 RepID=A0A2P8DRY6_9ACTN|nr:MFS transporter [Murinocardiopsis flavida]PSK99978.1 putative MFS family arabinose efflux permease [Murinocardiopsis flavida]